MVKQRSLGPDNMDDGSDGSSAFLDALRTRAMDDLVLAAEEYGIIMKDLGKQQSVMKLSYLSCLRLCFTAVIDRQFKGTGVRCRPKELNLIVSLGFRRDRCYNE